MSSSVSRLIDQAIRRELAEDQADLQVFEERANETTMPFEQLVKDLKADGKI